MVKLLPILYIIIMLSCKTKKQASPNASEMALQTEQAGKADAVIISSTGRKNLLLESGFEGEDFLNGWGNKQKCCDYSITQSSEVARAGKSAVKFVLLKTDEDVSKGKRSEITQNPESSTEVERWYGISFYLSDWATDPAPELIIQWHQTAEGNGIAPPLGLWVKNNNFFVAKTNDATGTGADRTDIGPVTINKWIDFVFHIKWSVKPGGLVEIWQDGKKVYSKEGVNNAGSIRGNYLKTGIYKWPWYTKYKGSYISNQEQRILYVDEVRIGNEHATYDDVKPGN